MSDSRSVTFDRLQAGDFQSDYLDWNFDVPPEVDQTRIVVNLRAIQSVGRWAGFGHVECTEQLSDEQSQGT